MENPIIRTEYIEDLSSDVLILRSDFAISRRKRILQSIKNFYRTYPFKILIFAYFGWMFDFYDLALFGFLKDAVAKDLQ